jgi:hypothetical protein
MAMKPPRWSAITQSAFEWEREALEFLREHLPEHEPWRAWANFEFIDDQGRVNEVDVLVLTPQGLVLVEIKSRPGAVEGDAYSWTWNTDRRRTTVDNPLRLANRKAQRSRRSSAAKPPSPRARCRPLGWRRRSSSPPCARRGSMRALATASFSAAGRGARTTTGSLAPLPVP